MPLPCPPVHTGCVPTAQETSKARDRPPPHQPGPAPREASTWDCTTSVVAEGTRASHLEPLGRQESSESWGWGAGPLGHSQQTGGPHRPQQAAPRAPRLGERLCVHGFCLSLQALGQMLGSWTRCPLGTGHSRVLSSNLGLHPLQTRSSHSCNSHECPQTWPRPRHGGRLSARPLLY